MPERIDMPALARDASTGSGLLLALLRAAARSSRLAIEACAPDQVRWVIEQGFGPLLHHALGDAAGSLSGPVGEAVRGAELTARVAAGERDDALGAILDQGRDRFQPPTLLKGVSVSTEYYPEPHFRVMRDIDFLVEEPAIPAVEAVLRSLGYRPRSHEPPSFFDTYHHITPFTHEGTGVWIEVHRGLFPPSRPELARDPVFDLGHLASQRRSSLFDGRGVYRLTPELELVYLATHWAHQPRRVGGAIPMLDVVYLLRATRDISWPTILGWLKRSVAAPAVYLLLNYLDREGVIDVPGQVLGELRAAQRRLGNAELAVLHWLIDRYFMEAGRLGGLLTARNFEKVWGGLLSPRSRPGSILWLPWHLLPTRLQRLWDRT
jgi:hypothetical protein